MSETSALGGAQAAFVERARVARLGTTMLDGTPHVVPICPVLDLDRGQTLYPDNGDYTGADGTVTVRVPSPLELNASPRPGS
jgi:hypothetical protein